MIEVLVGEFSAWVDQQDRQYFTPLHCAAQAGHADACLKLLDLGADIDATCAAATRLLSPRASPRPRHPPSPRSCYTNEHQGYTTAHMLAGMSEAKFKKLKVGSAQYRQTAQALKGRGARVEGKKCVVL